MDVDIDLSQALRTSDVERRCTNLLKMLQGMEREGGWRQEENVSTKTYFDGSYRHQGKKYYNTRTVSFLIQPGRLEHRVVSTEYGDRDAMGSYCRFENGKWEHDSY